MELHEKYQFTITLWTKLGILLGIILCNLYANRLGIEDDKNFGLIFGLELGNKVGSLLRIERGKVLCVLLRIRFGTIFGSRWKVYLAITLGTEL